MSRNDRKSKRKNRMEHGSAEDGVAAGLSTQTQESEAIETHVQSNEPESPERGSNLPVLITRDISIETPESNLDWPEQDWPAAVGGRGSGFQVVIKRSVLNAINRHGQTTTEVEVCGVLAGNVYRDSAGPYLRVDAAVRGEHSGNSTAQVTFTAETWSHIQGVMEKDHADLRIVGWYHTHPGFGIFLSDMDLFIHGNFFNLPWQIALVYDPISGEDGLFIWREGKTDRVPYFVEEDVEKEIVTMPVSAEITAAALADFSRRVQGIEKRQKGMLISLVFLLLVALAWPFVLYTIMSERPRETRMTVPDKNKIDPDPATRPSLATIRPNATEVSTPPADDGTLLSSAPTSAPVATIIRPAPPATTQTAAPANDHAFTRVKTTQPTSPVEKSDAIPTIIRPNPSTGNGTRVLEGTAETIKQNP